MQIVHTKTKGKRGGDMHEIRNENKMLTVRIIITTSWKLKRLDKDRFVGKRR